MKLNLACGDATLDGFINLDAQTGWLFESGLAYPDGSIEAVTCAHGLMYLPLADWPHAFAEIARVLEPGGVVRITEDDTENPESERYGGWHDAVTLTGPKVIRKHLRDAGLVARTVGPDETQFRDGLLIQALHGLPPKVCFMEGRKP